MDDAQLVVAALAGDRNAYAAIYDRYADRIHDFCASILRNRADAADALQETFLVAFEVLDQLAEPARLRSWLFAIAHRAVLDRMAQGGGSLGSLGDDAGDLVWDAASPEGRLSRAELAEFVWQASAGLSERDRALLDLHLRQGLDGRDLAGAAGVLPSQVDSRVPRLEDQVERSLGALLVARTSGRSCSDLSDIVSRWDGRLTTEFRDRVTAHVDDCEVCNSRRRIVPSPLALLGATPLAPAPAYLRGVVLGKAELASLEREGDFGPGPMSASSGWVFNRDGFPDLGAGERRIPGAGTGPVYASTRPTTVMPAAPAWAGAAAAAGAGPGAGAGAGYPTEATARATAPTTFLPTVDPRSPRSNHDRMGMLIGGLAGLIILIAGVVILVSNRSSGTSGTLGVGVTTTTASTAVSDTTPTSTAPIVVPTTNIPTTTKATTGHMIVGGSKTLNLGTTSSGTSLTVGNDGQAPLDFTATAAGTGLTVNPVAGNLGSGASQPLTVALDRSVAPPGPYTGTIQIAGAGSNVTVTITAIIDPGPMISGEMTASTSLVYGTNCPGHATPTSPTSSSVTASVTGTMPLKLVVLHWQSSMPGGTGTTTMTLLASSASATLGPFAFTMTGVVDWWITAIDTADATAISSHHSLTVACKP